MQKSLRALSSVLLTTFLVSVIPALAQEVQPPPPAGTIIVEQKTDVHTVGTWTMIKPNHEGFERTDANLTMPDMPPGKYTFIAVPPKGTVAKTEVYLGDEIIASSDTPQVSFELLDTMTAKVVVTYTLTVFGKVGVNSDPSGIPYELKGPDSMLVKGVTPAEYPEMPVGNYSVTYMPEGCPQPAAKSSLLGPEGRADFMIVLQCKGFVPSPSASSAGHVSTEIGGKEIFFTDVPSDSWFGPYIETVSKLGIMAGYAKEDGTSSGLFGPADPVTIAQLAKITHALIKLDEKLAVGAPKNTAAIGQWSTRYIASAEKEGWLLYLDGTIDPNRPATRAEVLITFLQALDIPLHWAKGTVFTDVAKNTAWSSAVETAASEGIVSGIKDDAGKDTGLFKPEQSVTRAEIAKIVIGVREKYLKRQTDQ